MFRMGFLSILLLCLSWPCLAANLPSQARVSVPPKTITIAADEWCPINCTPESYKEGVGIELARAVFEPLGYTVKYVVMPWARALEEVRKGTIDAVVGANTSDDNTLLFPKAAIYTIDDSYYVKKGSPITFYGVESLAKYKIGIIKDYGYNEEIMKLIERQHKKPGMIQETSGEDALQQNIRKLMAGRIDVLVESSAVMSYVVNQLQLDDKIVPIGFTRQGKVYLAFSPALARSKQLVAEYEAGIAKLRKEKRLGEIYTPYGLKPQVGIWP